MKHQLHQMPAFESSFRRSSLLIPSTQLRLQLLELDLNHQIRRAFGLLERVRVPELITLH